MNDWSMPQMNVEAHHVAGMIAIGAVIFLLLVEHGFRGLKLDIS